MSPVRLDRLTAGRSPGAPGHHDPVAVPLLGLLPLGGTARLRADGQVPGGAAAGRLQHRGAGRFGGGAGSGASGGRGWLVTSSAAVLASGAGW